MFEQMNEKIRNLGIIPVVVIDDANNAVSVAEAFVSAGLNCAEITFRTAAAEESIRNIRKEFGDSIILGAGTILNCENADRAIAAGADFIDSPVMDPEVIEHCIARQMPVYPGCATPSEIMQCMKRGLKAVKFFPAEDLGGPVVIKGIAAALQGVEFIASGGINKENIRNYLSMKKLVMAVAGSWMCKAAFINNGEFYKIEKLTREALYYANRIRNN